MEKPSFFYKIEKNGRINDLADEFNRVSTSVINKIEPPQSRQISKIAKRG
jgi:hypothetical protein